MRYVIMCAGKGTRWGGYLGIPKHLIEIDGEKLIERTVRLLWENGVNEEDIFITGFDERYAQYAQLIPQSCYDCEVDRFEESVIKEGEGICYLYGDVYYTDLAMKTIVKAHCNPFWFFGSDHEIFAVKVQDVEQFLKAKRKVKDLFMSGQIDRCIGWDVYRCINHIPFKQHKITRFYTRFIDETDDFDYPGKFRVWLRNHELQQRKKR